MTTKTYQVRRNLKYKTICAQCEKPLVRGDEGYWVTQRQEGAKTQVRCLTCGDWGSDIPHRKPRASPSRGDIPKPRAPEPERDPSELYVATLVTGLCDAARAAMPAASPRIRVGFVVVAKSPPEPPPARSTAGTMAIE